MGYKHSVEEIIEKGMELIRKEGYHKIGVNQILKECGIPKGSFYNFFESKEAFVAQALATYGANNLQMIKGLLGDPLLSPFERLKSFYKFLLDSNEQDHFSAGCLVNNLSNEVGYQSSTIGTAANTEFMTWVSEIAKTVKEGQESGEIRTDFSADALAEYLHAGLYGTFPRMKVTHSRDYMDNWYQMTFRFIQANKNP